MTGYLTEQQQVDHLKEWWKKNGIGSIIIFLFFFLAGLGWHYWLKHQEIKFERGSVHYEELLNAVVNDEDANAMKEAGLLQNNYPHTPYAALAALIIARSHLYQNDYDTAEKQLNWVIKNAPSVSLKQTARLRLARVYIYEKKPHQALDLLEKVNDTAYMPMIDEIRGDSFHALGETEKARTAYQKAVNSMPGYAVMRPVLAMKLDDLAGEKP